MVLPLVATETGVTGCCSTNNTVRCVVLLGGWKFNAGMNKREHLQRCRSERQDPVLFQKPVDRVMQFCRWSGRLCLKSRPRQTKNHANLVLCS
jgi:hypothetical protein